MNGGREQQYVAYLFVIPALVYVLAIFAYPFGYAVYLTFVDSGLNRPTTFVGLENYKAVLTDALFWRTLSTTVSFTLLSVPVIVVGALGAALALQSSFRLVFRGFFKTLYFLPVVASLVATALIWILLLNPTFGLVNSLLGSAGLPKPSWLEGTDTVVPTLAMLYVWARLGFATIIFIAGLEGIPQEFFEAARIDGAGRMSLFRHVTLPLVRPQLLLVTVLETIFALKVFALPFAATYGGPANASRTVVMHIYTLAFEFFRTGEAAVVAVLLFVMILVFTAFQRWATPRVLAG